MKLRLSIMAIILAMLLCGCTSWMDGEYRSVKPHLEEGYREEQEIIPVSNYREICEALEEMVASAVESGILSVGNYADDALDSHMKHAVQTVKNNYPIGAYAVESIHYEIGTKGGGAAVAITISYNYNRSVIPKIKRVKNADAAESLIVTALNTCETTLVMLVEEYHRMDYLQIIRQYAQDRPALVMETPQVIANEYPNSGLKRVVELQFTYQNSRDVLQNMQNYVQPVFASAALYVSGEEKESIKFSQLYSFLMERNDYTVETSITPAYSLLRHGVGDSKAFATVYASMCSRAGLNCQVISGTREGEPWYWNIICEDDVYYHVDLLRSHAGGAYRKLADDEMPGYVWDYSAYPVCGLTEKTTDDAS